MRKILLLLLVLFVAEAYGVRFAYVIHSSSSSITQFTVGENGDLIYKAKYYDDIGDLEDWGTYFNSKMYYTVSWDMTNSISLWSIDSTTGALTRESVVKTGMNPWALIMTNNEKCAYIGNFNSNTISQFQIEQGNGLFKPIGEYFTGYSGAAHVIITGDDAYAVAIFSNSNTIASYKINSNCRLTATNFSAKQSLFGPNRAKTIGRNAYIVSDLNNSIVHYQIGENGSLNFKSSITVDGMEPMGIAVLNNKFLYVGLRKSNEIQVFKINGDGELTKVKHYSTQGSGPRNVAFTSDHKHAYVANQFSNEISIFDVNESTGELKYIKKIPSEGNQPYGTSFVE
ncbi:MAG: beta-propeller fold lactonase family protein [Burkholderiales bacterium]|nr:beta-propeller fold lactonase family protein [Burkholderiales bacterium]